MIVGLVLIVITIYRFYKYRSELLDLALFAGTGLDLFILKDLKPLVTSIMSMRSESLMMSLVSAVSGLSSYASQATSYRWSLIIALILGLVICAIVVIGLLQEQGTFFISHFFDFFGYYSKEK